MRPVLLSLGGYDVLLSPVFTGLSAIAAFLYLRARRDHARLSVEDLWRLTLGLAVGVFAGAALLYLLLYGGGPQANLRFIAARGRIHGGSFFGALAGAFAAAWAYCRRRGLPFLSTADLLGAAAALGLAIKRLGCIMAGCCFGRPSSSPWAITFTDPRSKVRRAWLGEPLHPVQLYEAAGALAIFLALHYGVLRRVRRGDLPPGSSWAAFLLLYGLLRLALSPWRGSDPGVLRFAGLDTSQWLAAGSVCLGAWLAARLRARSPA